MPSLIVKPKPYEDFYVTWSTIVGAPTNYGDRAGYIRRGTPEDRLARADEHGSSAHRYDDDGTPFGWFHWDDSDPFLIANSPGGLGTLTRDQLRAYCEAMDADPDRAAAMVDPLSDDEA